MRKIQEISCRVRSGATPLKAMNIVARMEPIIPNVFTFNFL